MDDKVVRVSISLPPELARRLDLLAARDHAGKRSRAVAALLRDSVTKSGERGACNDNGDDLT